MRKFKALARMDRHYTHKIRAASRKCSRGKLQRCQVALETICRTGKTQSQFLDVFQHSQRLTEVAHNSLALSLLAFKANKPTTRTQQGTNPRRHAEATDRIECRIEADMSEVYLVLLLSGKTSKPLFVLPSRKSIG